MLMRVGLDGVVPGAGSVLKEWTALNVDPEPTL